MNKRIRKKKRLGEYKELGFEVSAALRARSSGEAIGALLDRLIHAVEARQLAFGGGTGRDGTLEGFITLQDRGSTTEDDRAAITAFFKSDAVVASHEVGPLRDAWYGWK